MAAPNAAAAETGLVAGSDLARAMATGVLRVADRMDGLGLSTGARTARRLDADAAFDAFDARALCLLLDPEGHDPAAPGSVSPEALAARTGLVVLHPALTDGLIEVQTIGRVEGPARPARRPTRIDAALAQPFVLSLLDQIRALLPVDTNEPCPGTLRAGSFIAGPASLGLILTASHYLRVDLEIELAQGHRQAGLSFVLPLDVAARATAEEPDPRGEWAPAMEAIAMEAPVRLEAVLPPLKMPLSRLVTLKVGDLIPIDAQALSRLSLHGGASGITVPGRARLPRGASLKARLGQLNGVRAVKIAALPGDAEGAEAGRDPEFGADAIAGFGVGPAPALGMSGNAREDALGTLPDLPGSPDFPDFPDLPDLP